MLLSISNLVRQQQIKAVGHFHLGDDIAMGKDDPLKQPLIYQADDMTQGDCALAIIGHRRIQVTEEEVGILPANWTPPFIIHHTVGYLPGYKLLRLILLSIEPEDSEENG